MFSFAAVLLFLRAAWSQVNQSELDDLCDVYYTACTGTCNTYKSAADSSCSGEADNKAYGKCFFNHDASYLGDGSFKHLALCLVENTKVIGDFTCFNNGTKNVECDSQITSNMAFNLAPGNSDGNVAAATEHTSMLAVQFGTMNVIVKPIAWDGNCLVTVNGSIIDTCEEAIADLIPHMNLHACKINDEQKTCSALMLGSTDANSTVDLTGNTYANPGDHYLTIVFPTPGNWRLLGHIQIYEEDTASGERTKWDIANGIDLNVLDIPTPFPTVAVESETERKTGGNNTALIVCLTIVGICGGGCLYCYYCGGFGDASYDEEYEVDPDYEGSADEMINTGIDDEKGNEQGGVELGATKTAPEMDQLSKGGLYAKLMANTNQTVGNSREPSPEANADLPPAPLAPGQNVV